MNKEKKLKTESKIFYYFKNLCLCYHKITVYKCRGENYVLSRIN